MATNNAHKLREIRQILGEGYEVKGLEDIGCHEDIPETTNTLEGNALQKVRYVHEHYGLDCFADDTGLEVEALDGAPGIFTARWGMMNGYGDSHDSEANIDCLLDKLQGQANRKARFRTAIALIRGGEEHLFEGIVEGDILEQRTGTDGFGYDPIFAPTEANGKSFAEIGPEGKNAISHRARATKKLVDFLRKAALLLVLFLSPLLANALQLGQWQLYRSFHEASQCVVAGTTIYVNYNGNLLSYDQEDEDVRTYNTLTGLNGITITHMAYCPAAKRLVLVYDDCGIDLIEENGKITHLAALKDKDISGKSVNSIRISGSMALLSTDFGMVELDVKDAIFRSTYNLQKKAAAAVLLGDTYYLATSAGLLAGKTSDNLYDNTSWKQVAGGNWTSLYLSGDVLLGSVGNNMSVYEPGKAVATLPYAWNKGNFDAGEAIVWIGSDKIYQCPKGTTEVTQLNVEGQEYAWSYAQIKGKNLWACEGLSGLRGYTEKDGTFVPNGKVITSDSPIRDLSYRLSWVGDRLLVAGGRNDGEMGRFPATSMIYEGGNWMVFSEMPVPADRPNMLIQNTTHLVQDPLDATHHFASVYRTGLCEYRDGKFVKLYDNSNSTLQSILPKNEKYYNYISCSGAQYDDEGNLWMLSSQCPEVVKMMTPEGKWYSLHYDEITAAPLCDNYLLHSSGIKFLNIRWGTPRGFFAFDTKGTLSTVKDDRHRLHSTIVNQDGTTYTPDYFYCMTEDLSGRIWCGTEMGLFVINDAEEFFKDDFRYEQIKVSRNDGSGLADYLLNGVGISCVAIDGGNRKWIGTTNSGVFLISADGQEMIHHFTTKDSPLLSDDICDIAVHPTTGQVMIGTTKGLCSFMGDATEAKAELDEDNVLAFPNPVTPDHVGPIVVRGLTMDSEVKILSASGQTVWSGVSTGGMFTWNGCNRQGNRVASGVYHVVANTADGEKAIVTRIVIIR